MLAITTGWTPDVIVDLPMAFRAACHWVLYGRAIAGDEGLQVPNVPPGASLAARQEAQRQRAQLIPLREALFPGDE